MLRCTASKKFEFVTKTITYSSGLRNAFSRRYPSKEYYYRWLNLDICFWYRNNSTIKWTTLERWSKAEKTTSKSLKNHGNVDGFLWLLLFWALRVPTKNQETYKNYYLSDFRRLCKESRRKGHEMWRENSWVLHRENSNSQSAIIICEFLPKISTITAPYTSYTPAIAPCYFF